MATLLERNREHVNVVRSVRDLPQTWNEVYSDEWHADPPPQYHRPEHPGAEQMFCVLFALIGERLVMLSLHERSLGLEAAAPFGDNETVGWYFVPDDELWSSQLCPCGAVDPSY